MDKSQVLQKYREIDTEITVGDTDFSAQFHAQGKNHSFFYVYDYDTDDHFIAIAAREESLKDALTTGTRISIGQGRGLDDGYNRTVLLERALIAQCSLEQAIQATGSVKDYAELEKKLADNASAPQVATKAPSLAP